VLKITNVATTRNFVYLTIWVSVSEEITHRNGSLQSVQPRTCHSSGG